MSAEPEPIGAWVPGLYGGTGSIALALLKVAQVLQSSAMLDRAVAVAARAVERPPAAPDLFLGMAGQIRLALLVWEVTGKMRFRDAAIELSSEMLDRRESASAGGLWRMPSGLGELSGGAYLGYAHGAAGIGCTFLDMYRAPGEERYLRVAEELGSMLSDRAMRSSSDEKAVWPMTAESTELGGAGWCHGAAGTGRFLLSLSQAGVAGAENLARRAARTAASLGRGSSAVQCHGLAGSIEFLLDFAVSSGDTAARAEADSLVEILDSHLVRRETGLVCCSESSDVITPDYLVGFAGVGACYLRLNLMIPESSPTCSEWHHNAGQAQDNGKVAALSRARVLEASRAAISA